jgi:secreted trypsin-like serine protease
MHLLSQSKLFLFLFASILYNTTYYECDKIDEKDSMQYIWTMIVSLRYDCQHKDDPFTHCCSGTILTESYILTAADCVDSLPRDVTIAAGIHNRSVSEQIIREVDQIIIHPNWTNDRNSVKHNIALLHLSNPINFTMDKYTTQICDPVRLNLPEDVLKYPSNSTQLLVMQWNSTKKDVDLITSVNLQETELSLVDNNDPICNGLIYDAKQQFCARFYDDSKSLF